MEFVVSEIKTCTAEKCQLAVDMGAIEAGGAERGREVIAVDITEYADPLCSRVMRVPFSVYLKPWQQRADCSGPVFVGSAVRVSFIFVEVIGEALDLFVFSEGRW
jgi:hypothetical protein